MGSIPCEEPPILAGLGMEPAAWLEYIRRKPERWYAALGPTDRLRLLAQSVGQKFIKGVGWWRQLGPQPGQIFITLSKAP